MTTFSQLVDDMVAETLRRDMVELTAEYLRQTIRECHTNPDKKQSALFDDNLVEDQITASSDSLIWDVPDSGRFQKLLAVRYENVWMDDSPVYAKFVKPGRGQIDANYFYYRTGSSFAFKGFGGAYCTVSLAYYMFPRGLKYRKLADRKVTYDLESGFSYDTSLTTPELQAAALELETNWLIQRWSEVIREGVRAKIYKRTGDDTRAVRCYSAFESARNTIWTAEGIQDGGWV